MRLRPRQLQKSWTRAVLGLLLVLGLGRAGPAASAESLANTTVYLPLMMKDSPPSTATQVVSLTNQERANAGCPALAINSKLTTAAQNHTVDMALNDFFSHTSPGGSTLSSRLAAVGYSYWSAAENIAAGYSTPASVVAGWMNSPGHRANILNCSFTEIGVGYYYLASDTGSVNYHSYWTQDFGRPR